MTIKDLIAAAARRLRLTPNAKAPEPPPRVEQRRNAEKNRCRHDGLTRRQRRKLEQAARRAAKEQEA